MPNKVKVTLTHAAYAGGNLRQAGDEVEVREELVEDFTRPVVEPAETLESLLKLTKGELLAIAAERGVEDVTADNNKNEIAAKILEK